MYQLDNNIVSNSPEGRPSLGKVEETQCIIRIRSIHVIVCVATLTVMQPTSLVLGTELLANYNGIHALVCADVVTICFMCELHMQFLVCTGMTPTLLKSY